MKYYHELHSVDLNLEPFISKHSADCNVTYKCVNGQPLYLSYYYPPNFSSANKHPVFIFIHGGSWESRKVFDDQPFWQGDYLGFLARYYAEKGFVCVSIDYRLVKENGQTEDNSLIDCYEDCCDAIAQIQATACKHGIDTGKMYLLGESAGGHLAACVSTFPNKRSCSFTTVFLVNPITDLNDPKWNGYVPIQSNHSKLRSLSVKERADFLSPLRRVDEHATVTVLLHGASDTCVAPVHSEAFYNKMCDLSRNCDLHLLSQTNHAFLLAEYTDNLNACKVAIQIIDSYLF